jgi:hypothetical protein
MKRCPQCQTVYADDSQAFCLTDGAVLQPVRDPEATLPAYDPNATWPMPPAPDTQPTRVNTQPSPPGRVVVPLTAAPPLSAPPQVVKQGVSPVVVGALVGLLILAFGALAAFALKDYWLTPPAAVTTTPTPAATPDERPAPVGKPTPKREVVVVRETPPPAPAPAPTTAPAPPNEPAYGTPGRYPEGSLRPISIGELGGRGCGELKIMRNEIFARRGYIFRTPDMIDYFSRQSWYRGTARDVGGRLSPVERGNVRTIQSYENSVGCR